MEISRAVCLNLDRSRERWCGFCEELNRIGRERWPFPRVERVAAIDGQLLQPPAWWGPTAPQSRKGQWGCYLSHLDLLRRARRERIESLLVFEDDVFFCGDIMTRWREFSAAVPEDWEQVYLGGNLLHADVHPPRRINEQVLAPGPVLATHAYIVRARALPRILDWLEDHESLPLLEKHAIDRFLAALHLTGRLTVYSPRGRWLCGQDAEWSDIREGPAEGPRYYNCEAML